MFSNLARFDGVKYGYRHADTENLHDMYTKTRSFGFNDEVKRRFSSAHSHFLAVTMMHIMIKQLEETINQNGF